MSIVTSAAKLLRTLRSSVSQPPPALNTDATTTLPRLVAEPWNLDQVTPTADGRLSLRGWAFHDPTLRLDQQAQRFTVNDEAPYSIDYPQLRPDVQEVFWQRPQPILVASLFPFCLRTRMA